MTLSQNGNDKSASFVYGGSRYIIEIVAAGRELRSSKDECSFLHLLFFLRLRTALPC